MTTKDVLSIEDLRTHFYGDEGAVKAVDGVSLTVREGEIMAVVGESGSGKSVTALSIMRLVDRPGRILTGSVTLNGSRNLLELSEEDMRRYRGGKIAMVFQNPLTSLDPLYLVGDQLVETARTHSGASQDAARHEALEMLRQVGIFDAEQVADSYPHQLGAGLRQRVAIAMALITQPEVLIADEPTTNLDALEQAHVLMLLEEIKTRFGTSVLLITHDFGIVATFADRVTVMYAGTVAESGPRPTIINKPLHPYTEALIASVPMIGSAAGRLHQIRGQVPNLARLPSGCSFNPRCPLVEGRCHEIDPELREVAPDHWVRCLVRGGTHD
jgi:peptide/nickel transport system ATP-binding protein